MTRLTLASDLAFADFRLAVDLELELAGITGLFGPSGGGKTTLLRVLAGLERGARGRIVLDGEVWQDDARGVFVPPHRRRVGYVFQDGRLFPHLSVAANLRFAEARVPAPERRLGRDDVIEVLDLAPLLDRRPGRLSGGEAQRVAIGRALLTSPRLLLMDEPLSALDMTRRAEILPYIERLRDAVDLPIIYVTHAIDEILRLAETVVLLAGGGVVAVDAAAAVLDRLELRALGPRFAADVLEPAVAGAWGRLSA